MSDEEKPQKPTREEAARAEFRNALRGAEEGAELVQPTADEARNGWTPETLTAYLTEQRASQALRINPASAMRKKPMPSRANSKYSPLRWRG